MQLKSNSSTLEHLIGIVKESQLSSKTFSIYLNKLIIKFLNWIKTQYFYSQRLSKWVENLDEELYHLSMMKIRCWSPSPQSILKILLWISLLSLI